MSLTSDIRISVVGELVGAGDLGNPSQKFSRLLTLTLATGTGASQADKVFSDQRTLTASATEDLDFAGSLTDALGAALTFAKIKAILVFAATTNTNNVVISRPAANGLVIFEAASDAIAVKPGGCFIWACPGTGITVTAGTGDLLTFTNSAAGTSVIYDIVVIGTSV
jgi:hypothetical protein